jgi:hypothetical protein
VHLRKKLPLLVADGSSKDRDDIQVRQPVAEVVQNQRAVYVHAEDV